MLTLLRDSQPWIKWNKFDIRRESFIDWIKLTSLITTLHNTARSKIDIALLDVTLTPEEVHQFTPTLEEKIADNQTVRFDNITRNRKVFCMSLILQMI